VCVFVCVCVSTTTAVIKGIVHQHKKVDMKFDTFLKINFQNADQKWQP